MQNVCEWTVHTVRTCNARRHTALVPTYGPRDRGAIQYSCCLELLPAVTLDANVAVSLFRNHKRNVVISLSGGDTVLLIE